MISVFKKRRGATQAGVFSLALGGLVLLCGAGSVPVENFLPQGVMQADLNAGGHNLTNAATVSATNVVVSGSLTAPANFTLSFAQLTGTPTTLSGYGITDPIVLTNGSYANPAWLTSLAYSKLSGAPTLATVATSGSYTDLSNKPTIPAAQVNSDWNASSGLAQILNKPTSWAWSAITGTPTTLSGYGVTVVPWADVTGAPSFLTANQAITVSGAATGSGTTSIPLTLANGVVGIANLSATGTPSSSTVLYGNNTWGAVPSNYITSLGANMTGFSVSSGVLNLSSALGTAAFTASSAYDAAGAASTAQSNAETFSGNGSNITSGTIAAARVATLNQATTNSSGSFTGSLAGDVTGTQGATTVGKINGVSMAGLATGMVKNTTATGAPSIAVAGTDYPGLATANAFTATQTAPGWQGLTGPSGSYLGVSGDSRMAGSQGGTTTTLINAVGYTALLPAHLQESGFAANMFVANYGLSGTGIQNGIVNYAGNGFSAANCTLTASSNSCTVSSASGITTGMVVMGPGLSFGTHVSAISGTTLTLAQVNGGAVPTTSTTTATLYFATASPCTNASNYNQYLPTLHELSPACSGASGSILISQYGINDVTTNSYSSSCTNGSGTFTVSSFSLLPVVGYGLSGTGYAAGTTVTSVTVSGTTATIGTSNNYTGTTGTQSLTVTPSSSAWLTQYGSFISTARADSWGDIVILTIPKAWTGGWLSGDSYRQAFNAGLISTYGTVSLGNGVYTSTATPNVYVLDAASLGIFSSYDTTIYLDGLHFVPLGNAILADYVNSCLETLFSSQMTGHPKLLSQNTQIPFDWIGPIPLLTIGEPLAYGGLSQSLNLVVIGNGSQAAAQFGSKLFQYNETGSWGFNANNILLPTAVSGTIPVMPGTTTSVSGSTSGTAAFSERSTRLIARR